MSSKHPSWTEDTVEMTEEDDEFAEMSSVGPTALPGPPPIPHLVFARVPSFPPSSIEPEPRSLSRRPTYPV